MHIEKRKSSKGLSYRARISVQGYPLQTKTFKTKKEALEWGREIEADLSRGRLGSPQDFIQDSFLRSLCMMQSLEIWNLQNFTF